MQRELERQAKEETVHLLNSLFRSQIAYFSEVKAALNPQTKRFQDISLYITRLSQAIDEQELDRKDELWQNIFEEVIDTYIGIHQINKLLISLLQFKDSPLLINRQSETGLTDLQYKTLLTGQKLQNISTKFVSDVADYFWEMAKISGKVVGNGIASQNE